MRILITNDDGIYAPGLAVLHEMAIELSGADGEVWIVAPAFEQSGVAHAISYTHPTMISEFGPRRYAVEGSPADCVLAALHHVLPDAPDLILSGVNRGNNAGENAVYSGTLGGALEGALQGVHSVALSQYFGPCNAKLDNPFESAVTHGVALLRCMLSEAPWGGEGYKIFYNVNFPPCASEDVKGVQATSQGYRGPARFSVVPHHSPSGRLFLWAKGGVQADPAEPGSDVAANLAGYISVTPMRADLTDFEALKTLNSIWS